MSMAEPPCYLCCRPGADSSDHVPPDTLFPNPKPGNLLTLPAHKTCNSEYSLDEEYFRDNISLLYSPHFKSVEPIFEKTRRSMLRREKKLFDLRNRIGRQVMLRSASGEELGLTSEFKITIDRMERVLIKIARGLYSHHVGPLELGGFSAHAYFKPTEILKDMIPYAKFRGNWGDSFYYLGAPAQSDPISVWWLEFFKSHLAIVIFDTPDSKEN